MLNRLLTLKEQFLLLFVGLSIVVGAIVLLMNRQRMEAELPGARIEADAKTAGLASGTTHSRKPDDAQAKKPARATSTPTAESAAPASSSTTPAARTPADVTPPATAPAALDTTAAAAKRTEIAVAITGAVNNEGLYRLDADARAGDLIDKAGGASETAELAGINLGARLIDGTTLTLPARATARLEDGKLTMRGAQDAASLNPPQYVRSLDAAPAADTPNGAPADTTRGTTPPTLTAHVAPAASDGLVDLNAATQTQLEALPGIGPALAQRIIQYRTTAPFTSVEQLDEVPGFGEKRVAQLRPLVKVN